MLEEIKPYSVSRKKKKSVHAVKSLRFGLNALNTYFYRSFPQVDTLDLRFRYDSIQTTTSPSSSDGSDVAFSQYIFEDC